MTQDQQNFITSANQEAKLAGHIFPLMAACEAALESSYGVSRLAINGNNLFGMKQHQHPAYGDLRLPTREFQTGEWITVTADFVSYPTIAACFADRMATLQRLRVIFANYDNALKATDASEYITEVSKTWSTDPNRAETVTAIYNEYAALQAVTEELA